jgi:hypothetical protein
MIFRPVIRNSRSSWVDLDAYWPMHDRRILPAFQRPLRNLILARKPNTFVALRIRKEAIEYTNTIRMAIYPVVHAYEHQPAADGALFIQCAELPSAGIGDNDIELAVPFRNHIVHA